VSASAGVVVVGVSKRYRLGDGSVVAAADGVSLVVGGGRRTALVGPSGSGKSTLLHLMGAIDVPDEGRITVGDVEVTALSRRRLADYRAGVGFEFHLLSALTRPRSNRPVHPRREIPHWSAPTPPPSSPATSASAVAAAIESGGREPRGRRLPR